MFGNVEFRLSQYFEGQVLPVGVRILELEAGRVVGYAACEVLDGEFVGELELDAGLQVGVFEGVDPFRDVPVPGRLVDAGVVDESEDGQVLEPGFVRLGGVLLDGACDQPEDQRVVVELDLLPVDVVAHLELLLLLEDVFVEVALQSLVREVDQQLFEGVRLEDFEAVDVQQLYFQVIREGFVVGPDLFVDPGYDVAEQTLV